MILGLLAHRPDKLALLDVRGDGPHDAHRDPALELEQIGEAALVLVGADNGAGLGVAQLGADPETAAVRRTLPYST